MSESYKVFVVGLNLELKFTGLAKSKSGHTIFLENKADIYSFISSPTGSLPNTVFEVSCYIDTNLILELGLGNQGQPTFWTQITKKIIRNYDIPPPHIQVEYIYTYEEVVIAFMRVIDDIRKKYKEIYYV
jgi:hypothetical protein